LETEQRTIEPVVDGFASKYWTPLAVVTKKPLLAEINQKL
jgi:hypothetical protein